MPLPAGLENEANGSSQTLRSPNDPSALAIIGIGCRLPGGIASPSQLWDFLSQERSAAGPIPSSRFNNDAYTGGKDEPASAVGPGGYLLQGDIRQFDNQFFGINNREAADMDPQQRCLLETVFECFESAGYSLSQVSGAQVGCYVASFLQDYSSLQTKDVEWLTRYSGVGMGTPILANRVSHAFNLKGPSCAIDTACSASIYALHQAVSALRNRECESAVVAGVNLLQSPDHHVSASQAGVISPTSVCHTFDISADGYGRADGVNAIYVKRLDDALRDGDPIRSIIRGTATNSNGRTPGITQPSIDGQISVVRKAYDQSGLNPSDTAYVEMHGTGTAIGDVMEAQSVARVFCEGSRSSPLLVGGVKPNLGHGEASSGLTSIIKATLALERRQLPATIDVVNLNPKLQLKENGIQLVQKAAPFPKPSPGLGRRISVNAFGYGGANAHAIIEEPGSYGRFATSRSRGDNSTTTQSRLDRTRPYLLPFSANDSYSLERRVQQIVQLNLQACVTADLAYTLGERRSHLKARGFVIAQPETLARDLTFQNLRLATATEPALAESRKFGFVFTGQGAQWQGMAEELLQVPVFANAISQMDEALADLPSPPFWKISTMLKDKSVCSPVNQARYAQPMTTAVQIALVDLLRVLRISADGAIGHSSGEIAAAYAANMIDMREAVTLAYYRGLAVANSAPLGAMAAVGLTSDIAGEWIRTECAGKGQVRVACINSPENVTISGDCDGVDALVSALTAMGIFARKLKTGDKAYHSHQMAAVGLTYESLLQDANIFPDAPAQVDDVENEGSCMFSTVFRRKVGKSDIRTTRYWRQNLESPVHFSDGLLSLAISLEDFYLVEVGPHTALKLPILQTLGKPTLYFGTLKRGQDSLSSLLELAGELFNSGFPVSFPHLQNLYPSSSSPPKLLHDLPTYPWHYEKLLWNESRIARETRERKYPRHELLGSPVPGGNLITFGWRNRLLLDNLPWLRDHKLGDETVFPGTAYLCMAVEAVLQTRGIGMSQDLANYSVSLQNVDLPSVLPIGDLDFIELCTELSPREISNLTQSPDWFDFKIVSIAVDKPTIRARGSVKLETGSSLAHYVLPRTNCRLISKSKRMWYESMHKCGLRYGPTFQHMQDIFTPDTNGVLYAQAKLNSINPRFESAQQSPRYFVHPAILDNVLQTNLIACAGGHLESMVAKIPKSFGRITLKAPSSAGSGATIRSASTVTGFATNDTNAALLDSNQNPLAHFEGVKFVKYSGSDRMEEVRHPLYRFVWKPDVDHIPNDNAFSAAIDHVRSTTDLGLLPDSSRDTMMVLDLTVHKDPNADILFLSSDLSLAELALTELFKAQTVHRRFNSFHLGRLGSDGQLEVAALQDYALPFEDSFSSFVTASSDQTFGLVISDEKTSHLDHLALHTKPATRIIDTSHGHEERFQSERFVVAHALSNTSGPGVRILRPAPKENDRASQRFNNVLLVTRTPSHEDDDYLRDHLGADLSLPVEKCKLTDIGNVSISKNTLVVSTVELQHDLMARATQEEYAAIQKILAKPVRMVWVSGSGLHEGSDPTRAVFHGLARAIMIEQPATEIFSLEMDPNASPADISYYVARVIARPEGCPPDYEYLQSKAGLLVSRGVPDERINDHFRNKHQGIAVQESLGSAGPVSLSLEKPGQLSTVRFIKEPKQNLGPEDVLVKVSWIGLNAKDVYALSGRVETPEATCSLEYTGKVLAIGSTVDGLAVGDHVAVGYPGHFSSHEVVPAYACVKLLPHEDLRSFASVLVVYGTALYALEHRAHLQPGESILIHSATGGVGNAAIQIAKLMGAEIFATVGTEEKKQNLVEHFGLQPDHILNSRISGFGAQIRSLTDGRGVDVVLNSLIGDLLFESWDCLAEFGRFVEIGKKDITDHGRLPMHSFKRSTTFTAFDLSSLYLAQSPAMRRFYHGLNTRIIELLRDGKVQPVQPLKSFTAADLIRAFRHFNDPARMGKIVISFEDPDLIIPVVPEQFVTQLHPDKSYVMVGCLGGLGRSLSQWMVSRGAKTFVFLGRSGMKKPAARRLVEDLEQQGAQCIVIQGDVTSSDDVERAFEAAPLPLGSWREGTAAKVEGAWNLHNALSKSDREIHLDFFIMTSSINGKIGTATESNYCAANNFLDVFARYRRTLGRPAIALGLGAIAEIGYLHEHSHIEELLLRKGIRFLTESDVLQIFDLALSKPPTIAHPSDIITQSLLLSGVEVTTLQRYHEQGFKTFWHSLHDVRFSILINTLKRASGSTAVEGGSTHESALCSAVALKDEAQVIAATQGTITQKLSHMVLIPVDNINVQASLSDFAMDSMLASELRQHIFSVTKVDISFLTLMDPKASVSSLCTIIASAMLQEPQ
ncbi:polyketide synthase [Penicillium pulvis]|uniref:polyketide synthase n=1 Tax=Penicillium pulvis TaxID=1562058 RepID=UPI00254806F6|nr:polyketide synthase [Penicillium pulvis]KAJ5797279.1 polyketide synthase [Penicillium pulvis]